VGPSFLSSPSNLPSLRKEHQRFDLLRSVNTSVGGGNGIAAVGIRPDSSGMNWSLGLLAVIVRFPVIVVPLD